MGNCFWWRSRQGQVVVSGGGGCHMGLFPPHYFHGLLSRDEMGRSASCLISVGGWCYFCDLLHYIWLFVLDTMRLLWGL